MGGSRKRSVREWERVRKDRGGVLPLHVSASWQHDIPTEADTQPVTPVYQLSGKHVCCWERRHSRPNRWLKNSFQTGRCQYMPDLFRELAMRYRNHRPLFVYSPTCWRSLSLSICLVPHMKTTIYPSESCHAVFCHIGQNKVKQLF